MMSECNQLPAFLQGFSVGEAISDHSGVICYPALHDESDDKYIVKEISVPQSPIQLAALQMTGAYANRREVLEYFKGIADEVLQEVHTLNMLSSLEGFLPYLASELQTKEDDTGYKIVLLSPYRTSLEQFFSEQVLTHQQIADIAMDLCAALAAARRAGYLYVDLKPGNIFFTQQDYRIGDLGFVPMSSLKYVSLPEKYISEYTAPEITGALSQLNTSMDVYALGLILYQAYNGGALPTERPGAGEPLPPPAYADYEMAQIILTACHPDPAARWQDPTAMGQALVQYMQQYGVSSDSIIPPPVSTPELDAGEDFLPEDDVSDEEWETIPELRYIRELAEIMSAGGSEEAAGEPLSDILAQADDLIAHELPDPVIAPDPVDVPIPAPIELPDEPSDEPAAPEEPVAEEVILQPAPELPFREEAEENEILPPPIPPLDEETPAQSPAEEPPVEVSEPRKRSIRRWILPGILLALSLVLILLGFRYYFHTYLQTVDNLKLTCTATSITVQVQSDIPDGLLYATCSDSYGNSKILPVEDGVAVFTELNAQTRYTIRLAISGRHKLQGDTTDTITTDSQTIVQNLTATIGPVDGSVYLSFQISGAESESWRLTCTAEGVGTRTLSFDGHSVTVYDLQIGKDYVFTLSSETEIVLVGETEICFTARNITRAENPVITHCGNGSLTVQWNAPAGETVSSWIVHCFNESGYDQTVTTDRCSFTFEGLTHETACTVEITASGMTQGVLTSVCSNPIYVSDFFWETDESQILIHWDYAGKNPEGLWLVSWIVDDLLQAEIETDATSLSLPYFPGCSYTVSIIAADGTAIFNHSHSFTCEEASQLNAFGIECSNLQFMLCTVPSEDEWQWSEIPQDAYKTTFSLGEAVGFVLWCDTEIDLAEGSVPFCFLLRDSQGALVHATSMDVAWNTIWDQGFSEWNLPYIPQVPGTYTLQVCIQGQLAGFVTFTIQ